MLLGNSADFDAIRARYQSLSYPTPEQAAFNATRASYEGLLTGSGYNTMMTPTSTPGQQVSFSVDPNTGQVTTNIPQYDIPTFENIYQTDEGLIGADGRPREASPVMGQPLPDVAQRTGGGGNFRDNMGPNVSTEFVGDRGFRIIDGQVTELDPNSLDYKFNSFFKGLLTSTPGAMLLGALGQDMTTPDIARIRSQSGDEAANLIQNVVKQQSILDNRKISDKESNFKQDTTAPGADASTLGGTGGRRGGAGPDGGRFGGDRNVGDASNIGGTGGRRGGAGGY